MIDPQTAIFGFNLWLIVLGVFSIAGAVLLNLIAAGRTTKRRKR